MKRQILALVLPFFMLNMWVPTARAETPPTPPPIPVVKVQPGTKVFRVTPSQAHAGDMLYLSGAGFKPGIRLALTVFCPDWSVGEAYLNNNYDRISQARGPVTDANGEFVNYRLRALHLHKIRSSLCTVYTALQDNLSPYGPDFPGLYFIQAPGVRLPRCERQICAHVSAAPKQVKSGRYESISIGPRITRNPTKSETSWPGALADITVTYPGAKPQHVVKKLNWNGVAEVRIRVPSGMTQTAVARVQVHFRAGPISGSADENFTVVR
jgi:hypothetical protein